MIALSLFFHFLSLHPSIQHTWCHIWLWHCCSSNALADPHLLVCQKSNLSAETWSTFDVSHDPSRCQNFSSLQLHPLCPWSEPNHDPSNAYEYTFSNCVHSSSWLDSKIRRGSWKTLAIETNILKSSIYLLWSFPFWSCLFLFKHRGRIQKECLEAFARLTTWFSFLRHSSNNTSHHSSMPSPNCFFLFTLPPFLRLQIVVIGGNKQTLISTAAPRA